jgi:integrase
VPISDSTRAALRAYAQQRDILGTHRRTDAFLVSERGKRLTGSAARHTFARISCVVGLRAATGSRRIGRGPRLQGFRHCFATRKLIEWYRAGLDVGRELPKLTTYLGHVDVAHTYWYLEAVPELLQLATERLGGRRADNESRLLPSTCRWSDAYDGVIDVGFFDAHWKKLISVKNEIR